MPDRAHPWAAAPQPALSAAVLCGHYGEVQVSVGVEGLPLAVNPNVVVAPPASEPFQDRFLTVTAVPLTV